MIRRALAARSCFNLIHLATSFKVDVFVLQGRPYDRAALGRKEHRSIDPVSPAGVVFFATAEDTVLAKLEWYRLGDEVSDRQWSDILGIFKLQGAKLDVDYMKKWAAELKVNDLLERAVKESAELPLRPDTPVVGAVIGNQGGKGSNMNSDVVLIVVGVVFCA